MHFVEISRDESGATAYFRLGSSAHRFVGANAYQLMVGAHLRTPFSGYQAERWQAAFHGALTVIISIIPLQTRAADPSLRTETVSTLDAAQAAGLNVLRIWAFADGPEEWHATQPSAGVHTWQSSLPTVYHWQCMFFSDG
jgi:hypothetical protein